MTWFLRRKASEPASEPDPLDGFSSREVQTAALDYVLGVGHSQPSWIGGTLAQCDSSDKRIAEERAKYADFEPARMRWAIMGWLDYYQRQTDVNRRDIETQKSRKDLDAYNEKSARERERVRELRAKLPRPENSR